MQCASQMCESCLHEVRLHLHASNHCCPTGWIKHCHEATNAQQGRIHAFCHGAQLMTYTEQFSGPSIGQIVRPHIGCGYALYYLVCEAAPRCQMHMSSSTA